MLRFIKRTSLRQTLAITDFDFPVSVLEKDVLMIGGSTRLRKKGMQKIGDLSGITTGNIPFWFQPFYKPGKKIAGERNWNKKIELIVEAAKDWDISVIAGVPA